MKYANFLACQSLEINRNGLGADGSGGMATITSSFYLLVKYAEVTPKSFICKGDSGTREFKPTDYNAGDRDLIDLWDFGTESSQHCSYSYHMPYGLYALTTSSEPGMAVAADRNPWMTSPAAEAKDAFRPVVRDALRAAFIPSINGMSAAGIVSLPGMMTGQILAGADPVEAVKYQIMISFLIAGGTGLGSFAAVYMARQRLTDSRHRLRLDRLMPAKGL